MDIRPYRKIKRRKTKKIKVGNVEVGGDSRIAIQSMTNTITSDVKSTILQILETDSKNSSERLLILEVRHEILRAAGNF